MGKNFGFSWSWRRAFGISGMKWRASKAIGIPLTRGGLERKMGRAIIQPLLELLGFRRRRR